MFDGISVGGVGQLSNMDNDTPRHEQHHFRTTQTETTPSTYLRFLRRRECLKTLGTRTRPRLARCSTLRGTVPTTVQRNRRYWPIPDSNLHRKHWFSNDHEWNHPGLHWGLQTGETEKGSTTAQRHNDTTAHNTISTRQPGNNTTPTNHVVLPM